MAPDPQVIASAAMAGPWRPDALTTRLAGCAGWGGPDEVGGVVAALLGRWRRRPRSSPDRVAAEVSALLGGRVRRRHVVPEEPSPEWRWPVEPWDDLDALARGLDLRGGELDWFADRAGLLHRLPDGPLHHYRRRWTMSRSGTPRLLEAPGPRLTELQRRGGGGCWRPSPCTTRRTATSAAARRTRSPTSTPAARPWLLLDLEGFFSHVTGGRVAGLLRTAGYPPAVASALAGLLVTATPVHVLRAAPAATDEGWEPRRRLLDRLSGPHLRQGAPTSPAVANLLAHHLDRRLAGLATAVGAAYGRYADDRMPRTRLEVAM